jgi:hypothetical protein
MVFTMRRDFWNFPSLQHKMAREAIFNDDVRKKVFILAMKVIGGAELTTEDLQLQANEPEALEKVLREIREFQEKQA